MSVQDLAVMRECDCRWVHVLTDGGVGGRDVLFLGLGVDGLGLRV